MKIVPLVVRCSLWSLVLALPSARATAAADGWGASYSFNAVQPPDSNHLTYAKTTLVPGRLPPITSGTGPLFIWPGLSNGKGDLVQTTLDLWNDNTGACGAAAGQWCGETSIFGSFGQLSGTSFAFDPDDHITIEYSLGSDNTTWIQTMTSQKAEKVVSTYSHASGPMLGNGFGFATEADKDSYTVDNQYYLCTELHLLQADPTWGPKSGGGNGAKYGATGTGSGPGTAKNLRTPDGGKTWLVDVITLPAMNPQGTQTPVPAYDCSSTGTGGSAGRGGSTGSGGSVGKGGSEGGGGTIGGGSLASDGSAGKGGNMGTGGSVGSDASTSSGSGGVVRLDGEASQGSGGTLAVGSGGTSGATSSGGATGANATAGSANAAAGTSGCGCAVGAPSPSPHGGWSVFLLLGALALRASRRRNRR